MARWIGPRRRRRRQRHGRKSQEHEHGRAVVSVASAAAVQRGSAAWYFATVDAVARALARLAQRAALTGERSLWANGGLRYESQMFVCLAPDIGRGDVVRLTSPEHSRATMLRQLDRTRSVEFRAMISTIALAIAFVVGAAAGIGVAAFSFAAWGAKPASEPLCKGLDLDDPVQRRRWEASE